MSKFGPGSKWAHAVGAAVSVAMVHYVNGNRQPKKEEPKQPPAPFTSHYDQIMLCRKSVTLPFGGTKCTEYYQPNTSSETKKKM